MPIMKWNQPSQATTEDASPHRRGPLARVLFVGTTVLIALQVAAGSAGAWNTYLAYSFQNGYQGMTGGYGFVSRAICQASGIAVEFPAVSTGIQGQSQTVSLRAYLQLRDPRSGQWLYVTTLDSRGASVYVAGPLFNALATTYPQGVSNPAAYMSYLPVSGHYDFRAVWVENWQHGSLVWLPPHIPVNDASVYYDACRY